MFPRRLKAWPAGTTHGQAWSGRSCRQRDRGTPGSSHRRTAAPPALVVQLPSGRSKFDEATHFGRGSVTRVSGDVGNGRRKEPAGHSPPRRGYTCGGRASRRRSYRRRWFSNTGMAAVPAACADALTVPRIDDRFAGLLRLLPPTLADADQDQAVLLFKHLPRSDGSSLPNIRVPGFRAQRSPGRAGLVSGVGGGSAAGVAAVSAGRGAVRAQPPSPIRYF